MKRTALLLLLLVTACATAQNKAAQQVAVLELFTSEGCSSCPPAEALVQQLHRENRSLLVLSYHVDYWDRLGWKDPFSKPEWTRRQNEYAAALRTQNLYTPQAVINGRGHITGSNRGGIEKLLQRHPLPQAGPKIQLRASESKGSYTIAYEAPLTAGEVLQIALVKKEATTIVKRGENGGRTLTHTNVVFSLQSVSNAKGTVAFSLPAGSTRSDWGLITFVQQKGAGAISSAVEMAL